MADHGVICCINNARDVGMVCIAITLANASADEGCYSLYVSSCGETPPSTGCITEFGNDHRSENFMKSRGGMPWYGGFLVHGGFVSMALLRLEHVQLLIGH